VSDEEIKRIKEKCQPLIKALWPEINTDIYVQWRIFEKKWGCLIPGPKEPLWEGQSYETTEDAFERVLPELKALIGERMRAKHREADALYELLVEADECQSNEDNPRCPHCLKVVKELNDTDGTL